jgi:hypothetical protein
MLMESPKAEDALEKLKERLSIADSVFVMAG